MSRIKPAPGPACYSAAMHKRTDRLTALYVDLAINLARSHGVAAGARALFEQGIPIELARRVLLRPGERRGATEHSPPGRPRIAG